MMNDSLDDKDLLCSSNLSDFQHSHPAYYGYIGIVECCLIPFALIGNILVVTSVIVFKCMRSHFKLILLSMSSWDIVTGLVTIPTRSAAFLRTKSLCNYTFCIVFCIFFFCGVGSTLCHLFVVAVDRIHAIHFPFSYRRLRKVKTGMLVVAWILLLTIFVLPPLGFNHFEQGERCDFFKVMPHIYKIVFRLYVVVLVAAFGLNVAVLVFKIKQKRQKRRQKRWREGATYRVTCLAFTLTSTCFMPILIAFAIIESEMEESQKVFILHVLEMGILSNSVWSPVVYLLLMREFRNAFFLLLTTPCYNWTRMRNYQLDKKLSKKMPILKSFKQKVGTTHKTESKQGDWGWGSISDCPSISFVEEGRSSGSFEALPIVLMPSFRVTPAATPGPAAIKYDSEVAEAADSERLGPWVHISSRIFDYMRKLSAPTRSALLPQRSLSFTAHEACKRHNVSQIQRPSVQHSASLFSLLAPNPTLSLPTSLTSFFENLHRNSVPEDQSD